MWNNIKSSIANIIKTNGRQEITGDLLQRVLHSMVDNIGLNATFAGIATPATNPGTPDGPVFYIVSEPGIYVNFDNFEITNTAYILEWSNGVWLSKDMHVLTKNYINAIIGESETTFQETITEDAYGYAKFSRVIPKGATLTSFENYDTSGSIQLYTGYPISPENLEKRVWASDIPYTLQNDVVAYRVDKNATDARFNFLIPSSGIYAQLEQKVNKEIGKGLSSNDFTDIDKADVADAILLVKRNVSPNLIDVSAKGVQKGVYLSDTGTGVNANYNTTDYIEIKPNTIYSYKQFSTETDIYQGEVRFARLFDSNKNAIGSRLSSVNRIQTTEDSVFLRITYFSATDMPMLVEGDVDITKYIPFGTEIMLDSNRIMQDSILEDKLAPEVRTKLNSAGGSIAKPNGYSTRIAEMQSGSALEFPRNSVKNRKTIAFSADIVSWNSSSKLVVGHGQNAYLATWLELDDVNVVIKQYTTQESVVKTITHELTISNNIQVKISQDSTETANISIVSNGVEFSTTSNWNGCNGKPFARLSSSVLSNCSLGWYSDTIVCNNWLFGDSYFNLDANERWTSYLMRDGYKNNMLNAYGGENSATALVELQNLLQLNKPKRIVWCMGMNDPDISSAANTSWKSALDTLKDICTTQNIELILSTIPSVIGGISDDDVSGNNGKFRSHKFKNAIVRASGYRYIDFDKAVGASEETGLWFGTTAADITGKTGLGMLSSDGVHPTTKGAKALYYQAIADCPEIATL